MNNSPVEDVTLLTELEKLLGEALLRYLLNIEEGELQGATLSANQRQSLLLLRTQFGGTAVSKDSSRLETYHTLAGIGTYIPEAKTSLANLLRGYSGGDVPGNIRSADKVLCPLLKIARDVWPAYLVPPPNEGPKTFWMSVPIGVYQHPEFSVVVNCILQDEVLKKLFPGKPDKEVLDTDSPLSQAIRYNSLVYSNSGRGGSLQLSGLVTSLISDGIFRAMMKYGKLTWLHIRATLKDALADLRLLADGKTAQVPMIVAFSGVMIPEGQQLSVGGGVLRQPTKPEKDLFLSEVGSMTAVFETTFPLKFLSIKEHIIKEGIDHTWSKLQPQFEEARRSFQHSLDLLRMSLLMASKPNEPWVAQEMGSFMSDVLSPGGMLAWDRGFSPAPSYNLDKSEEDNLREWYELISKKHVASLDVGLRRLLSATTTRKDPIDSFVDAVIVWENIFGVRAETTFRVTGSVAKLLEPLDTHKRQELQKELKDIYGQRSRLVHGGKEPSLVEIDRLKQRAVEIATECFRRLYQDRPDLLGLESDSRGALLLLE